MQISGGMRRERGRPGGNERRTGTIRSGEKRKAEAQGVEARSDGTSSSSASSSSSAARDADGRAMDGQSVDVTWCCRNRRSSCGDLDWVLRMT